jgi:voltage-gated sodium channel
MVELSRRLSSSEPFQRGVLGLIIVNAMVMGLETWPALTARWGSTFEAVNAVVQALFVIEIALRLTACGRRPQDFFKSGWNTFDFAVVALSLLPAAGPLATIARLARVLRVTRLISGMPDLRLIIGTMLRSIPSMGHVVMLLGLLVYVYGVIGHHMFGQIDPEHWGALDRAAKTLFMIITLEGWIEIMRASEAASPWAWLYYMSFIVIAVFVVTNLFIAVVINNLEKVRAEEAGDEPSPAGTSDGELRRLSARIEALTAAVESLRERDRVSHPDAPVSPR